MYRSGQTQETVADGSSRNGRRDCEGEIIDFVPEARVNDVRHYNEYSPVEVQFVKKKPNMLK